LVDEKVQKMMTEVSSNIKEWRVRKYARCALMLDKAAKKIEFKTTNVEDKM
jgi:hypothetical protein